MLLALDTATGTSGVALLDGPIVVAQSLFIGVTPGDVTVRQIDDLCRRAGVERGELSAVAVGVGPGPYTSTRIGVSIARTLAFALGIPVDGVCTHDAIAAQFAADREGLADGFAVATDARRREVYWARYDAAGRRTLGPDVGKPADVVADSQLRVWVGNGLERYPEIVELNALSVTLLPGPNAEWIGRIAVEARDSVTDGVTDSDPAVAVGELVDHDSSERIAIPTNQRLFAAYPLYLRRPDARLPAGAK